MFRLPLIAACLAAVSSVALTLPAHAQDTAEDSSDQPVVSPGLFSASFSDANGVKINRGPEVAPTPTEQRPVRSERAPIVVVPSSPDRRRAFFYGGNNFGNATRSRRASNFGFSVNSGDFFFRFGNAPRRAARQNGGGRRGNAPAQPQGIFPFGTPTN